MKGLEEYVSEYMFPDPYEGGAVVIKFLEGKHVVYHMKYLDQ